MGGGSLGVGHVVLQRERRRDACGSQCARPCEAILEDLAPAATMSELKRLFDRGEAARLLGCGR